MENFKTILALLMTYSYAQERHKNYNIRYNTYPMKVGIAKDNVMVIDNTPININYTYVLIENVGGYILGTTLQHH